MMTTMSIAYRRTVASRAATYVATLTAIGLLTGCAGTSTAPNSGTVLTVSLTACGTGWRHPTPELQTLQIHNAWTGGAVEVSLIGANTGAVYSRVENLGPGTTQPMQVDVGSGAYAFQCSGIFTNDYAPRVSRTIVVPGHVRGGVGILPVSYSDLQTVTNEARAYVASGLTALARQVTVLGADIKTGDLAAARTVWLTAHLTWERLGSAYGMFGNYDDMIDGLPFGLAEGVHDPGFTGFYRLEYGLWHGQSAADLTGPANQLEFNVRSLILAEPGMLLPPAQTLGDLALRTHEILENAMRFQISGQADFGSGTTLASMIHPKADVGWPGRAGCLWVLFPGSGDDGGPAGGPGGRGSTGPGYSFLDRRDGLVLVRGPAAGR